MLKTISAIVTAATVAGIATIVSAPTGGPVSAGPLPNKQEATLQGCKERAWPYNTCVGTAYPAPTVNSTRVLTA